MRLTPSKSAVAGVALAFMATSFVSVSAATSAEALGSDAWLCGQDNVFLGGSSNSGTSKGAYTKEGTGSDCGQVIVAYDYYVYAGSKLYWTGNTYGSSYVFQKGTNIVVGGGHRVTSCGIIPPYTCGPEYT